MAEVEVRIHPAALSFIQGFAATIRAVKELMDMGWQWDIIEPAVREAIRLNGLPLSGGYMDLIRRIYNNEARKRGWS